MHAQADHRPTYFKAAAEDPKVIGDRSAMFKFYREDVRRFMKLNDQLPSHAPCPDGATTSHRIRIVSWNINNLCGVAGMGKETVEPERIASVLRSTAADVIVLQEALDEPKDYDDQKCEDACLRMRSLDKLLKGDGYRIFRSDHAQPLVVATRLHVKQSFSMNLDQDHQWRERMTSSPGRLKRDADGKICVKVNESRPVQYVELQVGARTLGVFGTHFHHVNYTESSDGVRKAEARTLMSKVSQVDADALFIAGDFNQPRSQDQPGSEWRVVAEAFKRFKTPQDDGVAKVLQDAGFSASWDIHVPRNFPGCGAPPMTHWTGTTVDFLYFRTKKTFFWRSVACKVLGTYVVFTDLSDHLPIMVDLDMR